MAVDRSAPHRLRRRASRYAQAGWRACALILLPLLAAGCASDGGGAGNHGNKNAAYVRSVDSSQLIGLESAQVTGLLGAADFRRDDGPAEILQYRSSSCVLDLYLYRDDGSGDYRVKYIEARDRSLAQQAPQTCVNSVMRSRSGQFSG
jgi:hypothetical protein